MNDIVLTAIKEAIAKRKKQIKHIDKTLALGESRKVLISKLHNESNNMYSQVMRLYKERMIDEGEKLEAKYRLIDAQIDDLRKQIKKDYETEFAKMKKKRKIELEIMALNAELAHSIYSL